MPAPPSTAVRASSALLATVLAAVALVPALGGQARASAQLPFDFVDTLVAGDMQKPVNFDFLPDGRILVVEQVTARIRVVVPGAEVQPPPLGTVPEVRDEGGEAGLLGIAVDPRWPQRPHVYVLHNALNSPNLLLVRFNLTGDLLFETDGALALDSLSRRVILGDLPDDSYLHNGGTLEFGPDEMLHVAVGDDNVACGALDIHELRGKILRLDIRALPDGPGPIWPYSLLAPPDNPWAEDPDPRARIVLHRGLRNPWTFDFEPRTGAMVIADVGEASFEEINFVEAPGRNLGWPLLEGPQIFNPDCPGMDLTNLTAPVWSYPRVGVPATAIAGGICFRPDSTENGFPSLYWGNIFYYDFFEGSLRRLVATEFGWELATPVAGQPGLDSWGTGFDFAPRMRFGSDGGLWYLRGPELRRIHHEGVVGVPSGPLAGHALEMRAHPTPASGAVSLEFRLEVPAAASLDIFDVAGRRVRRLAGQHDLGAGPQRVTWDRRDDQGRMVAPGVYLARLEAGAARSQRRLVLVAER